MAARRHHNQPPGTELWTFRGQKWLVEVTNWAIVNGRVEPVAIELRSVRRDSKPTDLWLRGVLPSWTTEVDDAGPGSPAPVTSAVLRALPMALIHDIHAREVAYRKGLPGDARWLTRKRRKLIAPEDVARVYNEANGRQPLQAVMRAFGLSKNAAAARVRRARAARLITPTSKGRATGGMS